MDPTRRAFDASERTQFDEGRIVARLFGVGATHHEQRIEAILKVGVTVSRDKLDSARRPDRSRGRGNDIPLVAGQVGFPVPQLPILRIEKHIGGSAHIENIAARPDQQPDPAGLGDLLRYAAHDQFGHCAAFRHRIRDNLACV